MAETRPSSSCNSTHFTPNDYYLNYIGQELLAAPTVMVVSEVRHLSVIEFAGFVCPLVISGIDDEPKSAGRDRLPEIGAG